MLQLLSKFWLSLFMIKQQVQTRNKKLEDIWNEKIKTYDMTNTFIKFNLLELIGPLGNL